MSLLRNVFVEEDGQDMVEYGLVIALIVVGASVGYAAFFNQVNNALSGLGGQISNAM